MRVVLLWLALVTTASAEPRTEVGLVWQAPTVCPDVDEVRARIEQRLGSSIGRTIHGIAVEIAPDGDGNERRFVARIDLRAVTVANEIRVLTSARCDELTDAVAVVIARIAAENRQPLILERGQPVRLVERAPPPVVPRRWGGGVRVLGVSGVGALPQVAVGGEVAGYVRRRSLFAELAVARWLPSSGIGLDVAALRIGWRSPELPLHAWFAGELGSMANTQLVFDDDNSKTARWVGAGAGFGVAWSMTAHARLIGVFEVVFPLQRDQFGALHAKEADHPEVASARCGLGLEIGWR